jgi:hypothetical protein
MAKHKSGGKGDKGDELPKSNTTSGGKSPKPTDEPADFKAGEGIAVYPPSPGDQAGEKTDNVPPTKRLPPDPPPGEGGADELATLRAENAALKKVVANLGGNPAEVCKAATAELGEKAAKKAKGPTRKAVVSMPGIEDTEVEYAGDKDDDGAAIDAFKRHHGMWSTPVQPAVTHGAAKKPAKE